MMNDMTLLLVSGLFSLLTVLISVLATGIVTYSNQMRVMKKRWEKEDQIHAREKREQMIRDAQNFNMELHRPPSFIVQSGVSKSSTVPLSYPVDEPSHPVETIVPVQFSQPPGVNLAGFDLPQADLPGYFLQGVNLSGANLPEANLRGANLRTANLNEANLMHATLEKADLFEADLSGADLRGANLARASLNSANLSGADLTGANLEYADLSGSDLCGANLEGTNLDYGMLLIEPEYNSDTIWPRDFDPALIDRKATAEE